MAFWETIRGIFRKKEDGNLKKRFDDDDLEYTGEEAICWACQMPIHKSHKSRKLHGNRMHVFCFKKIKKIALNGGGVNDFC